MGAAVFIPNSTFRRCQQKSSSRRRTVRPSRAASQETDQFSHSMFSSPFPRPPISGHLQQEWTTIFRLLPLMLPLPWPPPRHQKHAKLCGRCVNRWSSPPGRLATSEPSFLWPQSLSLAHVSLRYALTFLPVVQVVLSALLSPSFHASAARSGISQKLHVLFIR